MSTALTLGLLAFGVTALVAYVATEISDRLSSRQAQTRLLLVSIAFVAAVMTLTGAWFGYQDGYRTGFEHSSSGMYLQE